MTSCLFLTNHPVLAQDPGTGDKIVSGVVTDEEGVGLIGVSVFVENTMIGVSTNSDGEYSITVPANKSKLMFSCIGYDSQSFNIIKSQRLDVVLSEEKQLLDQVVVVGYGVQKKESSVAAIAQVEGDALIKTNATSVADALSGQIPGVTVMRQSGEPGNESSHLIIRGVSSWVGSSPLVLVDGVERSYKNIDPTEIETLSVLKDASATAIFGVRGANGVIMITTKRGKAGKVRVNLSSETSLKQPTNMVSPKNSYETTFVINEAKKNDNDWGELLSDEVIEHYRTGDMPYVYTDTDWQDAMIKNSYQCKYNLNVSGGTDFARVFASLSYLHDDDIIKTEKNENYDPSYKFDRYNYRFNIDMNVTKTTLISIDAGGYIGIKNRPYETNNQRTFRNIYCLSPMDGVMFYPASVLDEYPDPAHPDDTGWRLGTTDITNFESPYVANSFSGSRTSKTTNVNISLRLKQDLSFITEGLSFKFNASYNNTYRWWKTVSYDAVSYKLNKDGTWTRRVGRDETGREDPAEIPSVSTEWMDGGYPHKSKYYEISLNYERKFGEHAVTGLIVGQRRKYDTNVTFPSYQQGLAARVTYDYSNKYLFEANLGYNGSEQFSPDKQYGLFPSFAIGYNLHKEKFFQRFRNIINRAKIRASWGQVGSDASGGDRWLFTSSFSTGSGWNYTPGTPSSSGTKKTPIVEDKAANINATWERATKRDIGLEIALLKSNMFVINIDFFNEYRTGILLTREAVPTYVGTQLKKMNMGKTKTKGYEIDVKWQYTTPSGDWYFFAEPAISFSDNRIISRDNPAYTPAYLKTEGYRIGQFFGYHHSGLIQDADVAMTSARYGSGLFGLGDVEWVDFNGDGIIDKNDRYKLGYSTGYPLYNFSFSLGFSYKNLSVDALFQGVSKISRLFVDSFSWPLHRLTNMVFDYQTDAWSPDNRDARYPSYHFDVNRTNNNIQDGGVTSINLYDASYIKLKNVNISYTLPSKITAKVKLSSARLFLRGTDLFTYAPNIPIDPEGSDSGDNLCNGFYPLTRTFTFGFQLGF